MLSISSCACWHLYIFFWKMSIQVFCPFLIGFFFILSYTSCLCILDINSLSVIVCEYFLPFRRLSFSFCCWFPCCEKADTFKFLVGQFSHVSSQLCKEVRVAGLYFMEGTGAQTGYCCSVTQSRLTSCSPMDCSTPGFLVLHHLPELAQTHVHWVVGAIQPSCPLPTPSPPAFNLSQHQGLFQLVGSSHQVIKALELQHQSFQWIFRVDFLRIDWFDLTAVQGTFRVLS